MGLNSQLLLLQLLLLQLLLLLLQLLLYKCLVLEGISLCQFIEGLPKSSSLLLQRIKAQRRHFPAAPAVAAAAAAVASVAAAAAATPRQPPSALAAQPGVSGDAEASRKP